MRKYFNVEKNILGAAASAMRRYFMFGGPINDARGS